LQGFAGIADDEGCGHSSVITLQTLGFPQSKSEMKNALNECCRHDFHHVTKVMKRVSKKF